MNNLDLIKSFINNSQYSDAIDLIADTEAEYLESEEYWNLRGIACLHIEAYEISESSFKTALDINPLNPDTHYNLATTYNLIGCSSDAALHFGLCYRYTDDSALKDELVQLFDNNNCKEVFDCARNNKNNSYIILSNIGWSDVQQRVHHIAKSLASFGNTVYFIEPKADISIQNHPDMKNLALSCSLEPTYTHNTLKAFKPLLVRDSSTGAIQHDSYLDVLKTLSERIINSNDDITILTYHPDSIDILNQYNLPHKLIYDCVDDHFDSDIAYWGGKDCILKEKELMDRSDFITTTATSLFVERAISQNRNNVFLSKNAVRERDFTIFDNDVPFDLKSIPEPRIVYSGFVYKRFDEKLFYELVQSNPDKSFIIIGPVSEGLLEDSYPNLYKLGVKKHSDLKNYLSNCNIGIVPHIEQCDMDIACDSIKQYEFLASGLNVITTFVPESVLDKSNIYTASSSNEFNKHIDLILSNNFENTETLNSFLSINSWNHRAALICNLVNNNIHHSDFNKGVDRVTNTLKNSIKLYKNPTLETLYIMATNDSITHKLELISNIYSKSKEKFIEKYYIKLLIQSEMYSNAFNICIKSRWVDSEIIDELKRLNIESDIDKIKILLALSINDFISAIEILNNSNLKEASVLYRSFIDSKLGINPSIEILHRLKKLHSDSHLYKFISTLNSNSPLLSGDIYIIGDDSAISMTMQRFVKERYPTAKEFLLEDLQNNSILSKSINDNCNVIVLGDAHYVNIIRYLAKQGLKKCSIALIINNDVTLVDVSENILEGVKNETYKKNIALLHMGAKDTNLHAIANLIPTEYKNKFNPILIPVENIADKRLSILIPLISSITVSGHGSAYWHLPNYTHHIETWHAGLSLKACGLMDPEDKNSGIGDIRLFQRASNFCVASHMDMVVKNSWFALSEDRYSIIGQPRTDYLFSSNGRANLEKILNKDFTNKTIILNMPTFHSFNKTGRAEGASDLNESIKIRNFDYKEFNHYLYKNDMVCISKVHPREAEVVSEMMAKYEGNLSNIFFLSNDDLDSFDINIYEILNGADILLTDYSSVYSDFLLLDRPTIFINSDIEEYRSTRGLAIEPYDYWTAGPKVQSQDRLQEELLLCSTDPSYYKEQRTQLLPIFHKYVDNNATKRFWDLVNNLPATK